MIGIFSGGAHRRFWSVAALGSALFLGACSALGVANTDFLPDEDDVATSFPSYDAVQMAYDSVKAGQTDRPALAKLGFDEQTAPNVERLSYLGVMDRFLPATALKFDSLAPAVQTCIQAQERCSAVVFRPEHIHQQRSGSLLLDLLGFRRITVDSGWSAEVIFLMKDNRVVYKVLQGKPRISEVHDRVQPLGPLQDLGNTAFGVGMHAARL